MKRKLYASYRSAAFRRLRLFLFLRLLPLLWSCTDTGAGDENGTEPIRIGVVGPLTSSLSEYGIPPRRAVDF